ncbi:MAG: MBOAT family O-acyltransferase [Oscillospiraceae bacterium]
MNYTSLNFIIFSAAFVAVYFLVPKKVQWIVLLLGNLYFYTFAGVKAAAFILFSSFTIFAAAQLVQRIKDKSELYISQNRDKESALLKAVKSKSEKQQKRVIFFALAANLGILIALKYMGFFAEIIDNLSNASISLPFLSVALPMGISFYTFALVGYLIDVYRRVCKAENNFLKFLLFSAYFPCVVQGPISRYAPLSVQLQAKHNFDYTQAAYGLQRVLWGFFKKLVIADRVSIFVAAIYDNYSEYSGTYLLLATFAFALQLYADFSGCMDIALGTSQILGIKLSENFNTPFFSHSIAEYWRRWHITLGAWFKDYVFYPLLKSKLFAQTGKLLAKPFGRKASNKITTYVGMLILWFLLGLWHGASWNFVIGTGILHWGYMVLADISAPLCKRAQKLMKINTQSTTYSIFTCVRTFLLVCVGFVFFRAENIQTALDIFKQIFTGVQPWVLFDGSLLQMGLDGKDFIVLIIATVILIVVDTLSQKIDVRQAIANKELPIRWAVYIAGFAAVLLFGIYGPAYDATPFIYVRF